MSPFSSPSSIPNPWSRLRSQASFRFSLGLLCLLGLGSLSACTPPLYTREQLLGAEPWKDLAAYPLLSEIRRLRSDQISVRGIRLGDPLERAHRLWGASSYGDSEHHAWLNADGAFLLRLHLRYRYSPATPTRAATLHRVIDVIEIFTAYRDQLHPENRPLLTFDTVRAERWRLNTFGTPQLLHKEELLERFSFPQNGFAFFLFSELVPKYKQNPVVFRIFSIAHPPAT